MRKAIITAALTAGVTALGAGAASAMPVAPNPSAAIAQTEQARVVCNEWGRCWRTGPRYGYPGYYYGPRRHYGHYGYYGRRHHYYHGGPGIHFRFGF